MEFDLDAYLRRIGYAGPRAPTLAVLRDLHVLHPAAIPFENLDARFGLAPSLELGALQAKLVQQRRGGWCFEHNALFQAALEAMGFEVESLIARVRWRQPEEAPTTSRTHRLCRVTLDGEDWIADVGFGGLVLTSPLRVADDVVQATPHEPFRLVRHGSGLEQQALLGDVWAPTYRFDLQPAPLVDYELGNWYCATHPQSPFLGMLMIARATADGRLTLADNDYARRGLDGRSQRRLLTSGSELAAVLRDDFGIEPPPHADLDRIAALHAAP